LSTRNNEDRFSAPQPDTDIPIDVLEEEPLGPNPFSFVVPTEFVDLPSRGQFYSSTHPLHGKETIEIKYMTAKEEDILTSQSLLEKGLALERLMANLIVNKRIKPDNLLSGDRNAILIAARKSGYGAQYETKVACPSCGETDTHNYNLDEAVVSLVPEGNELAELNVRKSKNGHFTIDLEKNPVTVEFRLLTGKEEMYLLRSAEKRKKKKLAQQLITDQLKLMIVSINGYTDKDLIEQFVDTMALTDVKILRKGAQEVTPNIELRKEFVCDQCGHEDEIEFPFTTDFFWPQS
jgi:predicted aspartyl protease